MTIYFIKTFKVILISSFIFHRTLSFLQIIQIFFKLFKFYAIFIQICFTLCKFYANCIQILFNLLQFNTSSIQRQMIRRKRIKTEDREPELRSGFIPIKDGKTYGYHQRYIKQHLNMVYGFRLDGLNWYHFWSCPNAFYIFEEWNWAKTLATSDSVQWQRFFHQNCQ